MDKRYIVFINIANGNNTSINDIFSLVIAGKSYLFICLYTHSAFLVHLYRTSSISTNSIWLPAPFLSLAIEKYYNVTTTLNLFYSKVFAFIDTQRAISFVK